MSLFQQRLSTLFKRTSQELPSKALALEQSGKDAQTFSVVPSLEGQVVPAGSPAHQEARALQAARFARATQSGNTSYLETVDFAPEHTISLVVRRKETGRLIGTARLELSGASIIEAIVRVQPGTDLARVMAQGAFAEVGGFATSFDLEWREVLDVIDTISASFIHLAEQQDIKQFLLFPRRTLMGLLLAQIPDLLPPYSFRLVHDVVGWREESPRLKAVRALQVKSLPASPDKLPVVFQIAPSIWAEDVHKRLALRERRYQTPELPRLLLGAMLQAQRQVDAELEALNRRHSMATNQNVSAEVSTVGNQHQGYLPFPATVNLKAEYLQQVMSQGGAAARQYKTMSYDLLQLAPGMSVLDVGCGAGVDLLALAERVGQTGQVVGVDHDPDVLQAARKSVAEHGNIFLVVSEAEKLPFLDAAFHRVRADRVLQHVKQPAEVLAEMARVLQPGGILVLVEPDWKGIVLTPGSQHGGNDDSVLESVLKRYQRHLPHALVGRHLHGLLMAQGVTTWEQIQVQAISFTLTAWPVVDTLLQLSTSARALAQEQASLKKEIESWLKAVEEAHQAGTFLASIPLFFATAQKVQKEVKPAASPSSSKG